MSQGDITVYQIEKGWKCGGHSSLSTGLHPEVVKIPQMAGHLGDGGLPVLWMGGVSLLMWMIEVCGRLKVIFPMISWPLPLSRGLVLLKEVCHCGGRLWGVLCSCLAECHSSFSVVFDQVVASNMQVCMPPW